jgi:hypothetical protein
MTMSVATDLAGWAQAVFAPDGGLRIAAAANGKIGA